MKKLTLIIAAFIVFSSHDMFLKMNTFFLQPNTIASLLLYNGTFDNSENAVARKRMQDVSLVGNGARIHPDSSQWTEVDSAAVLNFKTGEAGTWVAGLSTHPNNIALSAKDFNEYLEHDGVFDMLEWRRQNNALEKDAVEKYSKHVKAIFQVGDKKTEDWKTVLGYPIEFVPLSNPYDLSVGKTLKVRLLRDGQALPDQLVYAGFSAEGHSHDHREAGGAHRHDDTQLRTDANGEVSLKIDHEGQWFLRTIHLAHSTETGLTHESNWATLTFEVGHGHTHSHGLPGYVYWVAGLLILAGVFYFFRRK
jgi:hypothetical protein